MVRPGPAAAVLVLALAAPAAAVSAASAPSAATPSAATAPAATALSPTASGPASVRVRARSGPSAVSGTPRPTTATADDLNQPLPLLPAAPKMPPLAHPPAWESFTVVTLLSAPFTALWCGLLVAAVECVAQRKFPPTFKAPEEDITAVGAGALSVGIALFSLDWGPAKPAAAPSVPAASSAAPGPASPTASSAAAPLPSGASAAPASPTAQVLPRGRP